VDGLGGDASDISHSEAPGDNTDTETEADWIDEQHLTELAQKQPSKFEDAMKLEVRCGAIFATCPTHYFSSAHPGKAHILLQVALWLLMVACKNCRAKLTRCRNMMLRLTLL
jgi:hypothetical protein